MGINEQVEEKAQSIIKDMGEMPHYNATRAE